jgi:hypothetical protein
MAERCRALSCRADLGVDQAFQLGLLVLREGRSRVTSCPPGGHQLVQAPSLRLGEELIRTQAADDDQRIQFVGWKLCGE